MLSSLAKPSVYRSATTTLIRSFAVSKEVSHKPPIDQYGLHARYANATYTAASKVSMLDKVEQELLAIQQTASTNAGFASFLENPLISRNDKTLYVTELLAKKTSPITLNLMTTLAGNARLGEVQKVIDAYVKLMKAKRGEVEVTIISADKLNKIQMEAVTTAMKNQVPAGSKVLLNTKVDATILGGLQVQIGDKFLDLSIKSRIDGISRMAV